MFTKSQLDQLQKLLESNNKKIYDNIKATENTLKKEIKSTEVKLREEIKDTAQKLEEKLEKKLSKKIEISQEDTINVLSELMHTGYEMHEIRIKRLEDELELPPIKN